MTSRFACALLGLVVSLTTQSDAQPSKGGWKEWGEDKKTHCVDQVDAPVVSNASIEENYTIEDDADIEDEKCAKIKHMKGDGSMKEEKSFKFKCNHNKEMIMEEFEDKECGGGKHSRYMDKPDAANFRSGKCADMKEGYGNKGRRGPRGGGGPGGPGEGRGPPPGGGPDGEKGGEGRGPPPGGGPDGGKGEMGPEGHGKGRGKFVGSDEMRGKLPDCDDAFSGFLVEYEEDEGCGEKLKSDSMFKSTFGIKKKKAPTGKKGNFKANACQEISEESDDTDPKDGGMQIECDASDGTLKITIYDAPDCTGNPRDERMMERNEQVKLKDGQCGKFKQKRKGGKEVEGDKFGHMKKDELPTELLVDCGTQDSANSAVSLCSTMSVLIAIVSLLTH